ncbi:NLR family CARD domain-containing protein 3 [Salminus brasiliensis]|uniref:NLR family CARD domain-containing protein 3 n=1 Tax=Salminus brasiliensis TaxID=930266 RepID=UPI003B83269A
MALGPCSAELQKRRVELVKNWSKQIDSLLDVLFNMGTVTEEDISLIRGGGCTGERDCLRTLLDVLQGRGEEACRAFLFVLSNVQTSEATGIAKFFPQNTMKEHLQKHKDILAKQHYPVLSNYLSRPVDLSRPFTDITFCRQVGYPVPLQYQHEAAVVGDPFRAGRGEGGRQGETCAFRQVYQNLLCVSENGVALLSGVAGSGKTTVIRRLVQEWAADVNAQKVILSMSFRELNLITEPQSLQGLLSDHYSHLKTILLELMTSNQGQILLILDGLDEFCFPLDFERTPKCSDPERELSVGALLVNLIKGNLLPGTAILLTSRPHAVAKVPQLLVRQFYSVLGFSPAQQQQYFEQNCSSSQAAATVWSFVSSHRPLQLMCHIPAFCWIVSTALHDGTSCLFSDAVQTGAALQKSRSGCTEEVSGATCPSEPNTALANFPAAQSFSRPVTVTEIYCCFLKSIVVFHVGGCMEGMHLNRLQDAPRVLKENKAKLKCLGALAFRGLLERRFLFDLSDLSSFSLDRCELTQAFMVEVLKEDKASLTYEKSFHFIHTSVQEFLAALYYVLESFSGSDPFSGLKPTVGLLPPTAHKLLMSIVNKRRPQQVLLRCVKKALQCGERHQSGHMDLFCRFVSGLFVPKTRFILDGLFSGESRHRLPLCVPLPSATPPFVVQLLRSQLYSSSLSPERQLNICHCLYEAQDSGLSLRLQHWLKVLSQKTSGQFASLNRDWSELAFLLQLSPDLQQLNLDAQGLNAEGLRRLLPVLPLFSTVSLGQNPLGPEGAEVLSLALQSPDCQIERLWVVSTELGCEGLRILAEGLKDNKTVFDLRMAINGIGDIGAACLAELLKANRTLRDIRLRDNLVTDRGAERLMEALMKNTTLEYLWLFDNKLSRDCVQKLKQFSKSRSNLDIKVCY